MLLEFTQTPAIQAKVWLVALLKESRDATEYQERLERVFKVFRVLVPVLDQHLIRKEHGKPSNALPGLPSGVEVGQGSQRNHSSPAHHAHLQPRAPSPTLHRAPLCSHMLLSPALYHARPWPFSLPSQPVDWSWC